MSAIDDSNTERVFLIPREMESKSYRDALIGKVECYDGI